ncbi:hypothetical protein [Bacillus marasmi]|uniref:hypothetical protein n=1 Tax=Bacillus marasmi TaxID=1926279 RepID=UPI0011C884AC|nr:hypothetical protein [Bacillus marasmi]
MNCLPLLKKAAESGEMLEMIYISNKGEITQRKIKVINVSEKIFTAYCYLRHKRRVFKQSNILSIAPIRMSRKQGA